MFSLLRRDDRGFTLVELMMVIVILGILAGVSVPLIGSMRDNAWKNKLATTCDTLGMVAATYTIEYGDAPGNAAAFDTLATVPDNIELVDTLPDTDTRDNSLGYIVYTFNDTSDPKTMTFTAYPPGKDTGTAYEYMW